MDTVNLTILLILSALIATTVSIFWKHGHWAKYVLFTLALVASLGAVHEAYEDEREYRDTMSRLKVTFALLEQTSSMLKHLVITGTSLPVGFEERLGAAAETIGREQGYGWSSVRKQGIDWKSADFGYVISFGDLGRPNPNSEYTEYLAQRGYGRGMVYVSKSTIYELVLESLKGYDVTELLRDKGFWTWEEVDFSDPKIQESVSAIVRFAYPIVTNTIPVERLFLRDPDNVWVKFDTLRHGYLEVVVESGECEYIFAPTDVGILQQLVGFDAIASGGRLASYLLEKIEDDLGDLDSKLICRKSRR